MPNFSMQCASRRITRMSVTCDLERSVTNSHGFVNTHGRFVSELVRCVIRGAAPRSDRLSAAPPHGRGTGRRPPINIWQLCAYGSPASSSHTMSGPNSPPQAAALQPGYLKSSAPLQPPPRSLCAQVRPAAAARGGNARRICPNWWPDLCCRWINFWLCFQISAFEMPRPKRRFSRSRAAATC